MLAIGAEKGFHSYFYNKELESPEVGLFEDCTKSLGNLKYVEVSLCYYEFHGT